MKDCVDTKTREILSGREQSGTRETERLAGDESGKSIKGTFLEESPVSVPRKIILCCGAEA